MANPYSGAALLAGDISEAITESLKGLNAGLVEGENIRMKKLQEEQLMQQIRQMAQGQADQAQFAEWLRRGGMSPQPMMSAGTPDVFRGLTQAEQEEAGARLFEAGAKDRANRAQFPGMPGTPPSTQPYVDALGRAQMRTPGTPPGPTGKFLPPRFNPKGLTFPGALTKAWEAYNKTYGTPLDVESLREIAKIPEDDPKWREKVAAIYARTDPAKAIQFKPDVWKEKEEARKAAWEQAEPGLRAQLLEIEASGAPEQVKGLARNSYLRQDPKGFELAYNQWLKHQEFSEKLKVQADNYTKQHQDRLARIEENRRRNDKKGPSGLKAHLDYLQKERVSVDKDLAAARRDLINFIGKSGSDSREAKLAEQHIQTLEATKAAIGNEINAAELAYEQSLQKGAPAPAPGGTAAPAAGGAAHPTEEGEMTSPSGFKIRIKK